MNADAPLEPTKRRLLVVVPNSVPFRTLGAYAQAVLGSVFCPIDVLVHECKSPRSDFSLRRSRIGLIGALDEWCYSVAESVLTPWETAVNRLGLPTFTNLFHTVPSLRDQSFETFVSVGGYDVLLGLGCDYVPVERLPADLTAMNIHPGILPRYKGLGNPEAWLRRDFRNMGVTIHQMTSRLDAGEVVIQKRIAGIKHLNIPLAYLVSYKVGIDKLAKMNAHPSFEPGVSLDDGLQQTSNLWRMRLTMYISGRLRRLVPRNPAFEG